MSWGIFDYFSQKNNGVDSQEKINTLPNGIDSVNETKNDAKKDMFMEGYLASLDNLNGVEYFQDDSKSFQKEAENLKKRYKENPVKVSLEAGDELFFNQNKSQTLNKKEVINETDPRGADQKDLTKEEALKLVKNQEFVKDFKYRRARINNMAKENCSDYEQSFYYCMKNGPYSERLSLCHVKYAAFCDCVTSQEEILERVGYAKFGNHSKVDEQLAEAAYDVLIETNTKNN